MMQRLLGGCLALLLIAPAGAQPNANSDAVTNEPVDFSELLEQAKNARDSARNIDAKREQEFREARNNQQQLLEQAEADLAAAKQRSEDLRKNFTEKQQRIAASQQQLEVAQGDLAGLFSAAKDASGNLQATIASSLLAIDHQPALAVLSNIASNRDSDNTRSAQELDALNNWLLQTAIATGEIMRFKTDVVQLDGSRRAEEVVRIGVFNAISGTDYLEFIPDINSLQVLTRQPPESAQMTAGEFSQARDSQTMFVDPTSGSLLSALVARPDFMARVEQGGVVGYVIIGLAALGVLIVIVRLVALFISGLKIWRQRRRLNNLSSKNALGRVLLAADQAELVDSHHENLELRLDEAVLKETPHLERGLAIVKLLAAIAPLLGLLGTVVGMIETFYTISIYGTGDPKLMADGISQALVTTMLGLIAAIPLLGSYVLLWLLSNRLIHTLDQESASLLVRRFEAPKNQATLEPIVEPRVS